MAEHNFVSSKSLWRKLQDSTGIPGSRISEAHLVLRRDGLAQWYIVMYADADEAETVMEYKLLEVGEVT